MCLEGHVVRGRISGVYQHGATLNKWTNKIKTTFNGQNLIKRRLCHAAYLLALGNKTAPANKLAPYLALS